jgi:hypothetical protein
MVSTRLLGIWLLFIGILWVLIASWVLLVMSGFSVPAITLPLLFVLYYCAPVVLIIGSSLVIAGRYPRVGIVLALIACAYLTYLIAPDYIDLLYPKRPLEAPRPCLFLAIVAAVVLATDAVAVILFRRLTKPSNQTLQPTAGR